MKIMTTLLSAAVITLAAATGASADIKGDMEAGLTSAQVLVNALGKEPADEEVSAVVAEMITNGANAADVVEAAIQANYNPRAVIIGALSAQAKLSSIIKAALANGVDPDDCSGFCIEGGADPDLVAEAIAQALEGGIDVDLTSSDPDESLPQPMYPTGGTGGGGGGDLSANQ